MAQQQAEGSKSAKEGEGWQEGVEHTLSSSLTKSTISESLGGGAIGVVVRLALAPETEAAGLGSDCRLEDGPATVVVERRDGRPACRY